MKFPLSAILSIVGTKLMGDIGGVYEILNYMTDDNLFTHQLPRVGDECRPYLLKQYPFLQEYIDKINNTVNTANWKEILAKCEDNWGKELDVEPIPPDDHSYRDPLGELIQMKDGKEKIIVVEHD